MITFQNICEQIDRVAQIVIQLREENVSLKAENDVLRNVNVDLVKVLNENKRLHEHIRFLECSMRFPVPDDGK